MRLAERSLLGGFDCSNSVALFVWPSCRPEPQGHLPKSLDPTCCIVVRFTRVEGFGLSCGGIVVKSDIKVCGRWGPFLLFRGVVEFWGGWPNPDP